MTENVHTTYDEKGAESETLIFEVVPETILSQYTSSTRLGPVFCEMLDEHSILSDSAFEHGDTDELGVEFKHTCNIHSVLTFTAGSERSKAWLRTWIVDVFLPGILPDLLATMDALMEIRKADADEFEEECDRWVGRHNDRRHLVLVSSLREAAAAH